ncbi:dephospho-CoA kinase [Methylomagnum ishizawai]|uniref:Dephospho-CoA kinase n=1 Tax=Methylomagnum ishizawai TaxID=1760988 RepID=A0A1Y6CWD8_9GAMM|nr:dephospho-CoA kinase [Methylomagnum ishizawai]SMF94978.1 dephospho-CoA kinase [Methylomagnum ishizawai]
MFKVGLTGGIGSGKTTVAELFAAKGVPVLDADRVARDLVEPGQPALAAIAGRFGPDILKAGCLDRERLRRIVFADPAERRWLEALLHPRVYAELERRMAALATPYCLLVVPLLLETGRRGLVDRLLVVDCPVGLQRQRLQTRDGIDAAQANRMLSAQIDRPQRQAAADDILENTGTVADLAGPVERLHRLYLALASDSRPGNAAPPP